MSELHQLKNGLQDYDDDHKIGSEVKEDVQEIVAADEPIDPIVEKRVLRKIDSVVLIIFGTWSL